MELRVDPEWIKKQRELNWPDMHPEDYCHLCGIKNPCWFASKEDWELATKEWTGGGDGGICCPLCFVEMYEKATGKKAVMIVLFKKDNDTELTN